MASHAAIHWLHIKAVGLGYKRYGSTEEPATAVLYGSSPAYDDIDWNLVSEAIGEGIESWATAGSSPSEWEVQSDRSRIDARAFIVISPSELNEYFLCDFRGDMVPLARTISDLKQSREGWQFSRRMLSQYALSVIRKLFPTVGRSDGVLVGLRSKLATLFGGLLPVDTGDAPMFGGASSEVTEKLTDWSAAHVQRRLDLVRAACLGKHTFDGPKKLALIRLLRHTQDQGQVILVVLPLSPIYENAFLAPEVMQRFNQSLFDLQQLLPDVHLIRLDEISSLHNNEYFSDFVHMNVYGQRIATQAFLRDLKDLDISSHSKKEAGNSPPITAKKQDL